MHNIYIYVFIMHILRTMIERMITIMITKRMLTVYDVVVNNV